MWMARLIVDRDAAVAAVPNDLFDSLDRAIEYVDFHPVDRQPEADDPWTQAADFRHRCGRRDIDQIPDDQEQSRDVGLGAFAK